MRAVRLLVPLGVRRMPVWATNLWIGVLNSTGALTQSPVSGSLASIAIYFIDLGFSTWSQLVAVVVGRLTASGHAWSVGSPLGL